MTNPLNPSQAVAEPLPVVAWRVEWTETDPRDPGNWVQWHDTEEPPDAWDDEEPTEIVALTPQAPAQAIIDTLRAENYRLTRERDALAAQKLAVPAGWVMVPLEPTQEMCQQGQWKAREWPKFPLRIVSIWDAMLAAAPTLKGEQE